MRRWICPSTIFGNGRK